QDATADAGDDQPDSQGGEGAQTRRRPLPTPGTVLARQKAAGRPPVRAAGEALRLRTPRTRRPARTPPRLDPRSPAGRPRATGRPMMMTPQVRPARAGAGASAAGVRPKAEPTR